MSERTQMETGTASSRLPQVKRHEIVDPELLAVLDRAEHLSTPKPAWYLTLAHDPEMAVAYARFWDLAHRGGRVEHTTKELMRIAISQLLGCDFCAEQRSVRALEDGLQEEDAQACAMPDFNHPDPRVRAALGYARAIVPRTTVRRLTRPTRRCGRSSQMPKWWSSVASPRSRSAASSCRAACVSSRDPTSPRSRKGAMTNFEYANASVVLDPAPMALEMGVQRLDSEVQLVAARTDMARCSGRMFEWWFRFAPDTEQYAWWHPLDHVSSEWRETNPHTHVGSTHVVRERLNGSEVHDLLIHFVDESEFFAAETAAEARRRGDVSALVCAHIGLGHDAPRDEKGRPVGGKMCHVARDTADGMVLRSRFWIGEGTPAEVAAAIPQELGINLMQHAHTEFKYLARFLPSLYIAENREHERAPTPW